MKRTRASKSRKLSGIYLRGKVFWYTYRINGQKKAGSLKTKDYGEAVQKALEIRQNPELAPAAVFAREIEAFIAHKLARNEYSQRSAGVKVRALKELAATTGRANPVQVTTADTTTFYQRLQGRVAESTAQGYVVTASSFFNWLMSEGKMRRSPVAEVRLDRYDQKGQDKFCTPALRDQLIAGATEDDLKLILFLGSHAGLRKNEIIEAQPEWFDLERGLLTVNETKTFCLKDWEQRTMPLTGAFKAILARTAYPVHSFCTQRLSTGKASTATTSRDPPLLI